MKKNKQTDPFLVGKILRHMIAAAPQAAAQAAESTAKIAEILFDFKNQELNTPLHRKGQEEADD